MCSLTIPICHQFRIQSNLYDRSRLFPSNAKLFKIRDKNVGNTPPDIMKKNLPHLHFQLTKTM